MGSKIKFPFKFSLVLLILTLLCGAGCDTTEPPIIPPPPPMQKDSIVINIADVTHRSVSVSLQSAVVSPQSKTVKLFRELSGTNNLVAELPGVITDTTIIDDDNGAGLLLDTTYSYYAISIDSTGSAKDTSNTVTARTLAPTTHNYTWTEYTIGEWQSALYDVWGTDENNVWACGGVKINDTTYGVIKWNGTEWLGDKKVGGQYTVYGFSENDVWSAGESVNYFDGLEWKQVDAKKVNNQFIPLDTVLFENRPYTSAWGTSSSNLYLGNEWGKIIHWDGQKATDVGIQGEDRINDIWGFSENEIFAVGTNLNDRDHLYYFNGINWQIIKEADTFPNEELLAKPLLSVYGKNPKEVYLAGRRIYRKTNNEWLEVGNFSTIHKKIRGSNSNNIFVVGNQATVYHYNGVNWLNLEPTSNTNIGFYGVFVTDNKVFIVGDNNSTAFIYKGENF
ncbi:MAG: hypothetical protein MUO34_13490 [Ignavibacteriaceae bacterium]|nr:hypothetical protein [Ignavibacteriaceae bacterium]